MAEVLLGSGASSQAGTKSSIGAFSAAGDCRLGWIRVCRAVRGGLRLGLLDYCRLLFGRLPVLLQERQAGLALRPE